MVTIKVPATTANVGPGFDCLGIAFDMFNTFTFQETKNGVTFEGFEERYMCEENMVYQAFEKTLEKLGKKVTGVHITNCSDIPVSRGLGSSAACIVAGIAGANALVGSPLNTEEIFALASEIEGHPDNVAPAVFGGMTAAASTSKGFVAEQIQVAKGLNFYAFVPNFEVSTAEARAALPKTIAYGDAVSNVAKVAMLIACLQSGQFDLLKDFLEEKLHQPYRKHLVPGFDEILKGGYEAEAYGVFLSGAGPTIMALADEENTEFAEKMQPTLKTLTYKWKIYPLAMNTTGLQVVTEQ